MSPPTPVTPPALQVLILLGSTALPSAHSQRRSSFQVGDSLNPLRYRHQRTTTMLQAATNVPLALLASLASIALVDFRASLFPLPLHAQKCLIFVQLDDHTTHELATTPSALCFPPMDPPSPVAISRALAPLRRATRELQSLGAANTKDLAVLVYTANPHVPSQISDAAMAFGAHALLSPPFTPPAVEKAMQDALERRAAETTTSRNTLKADFQLRFQLPSMIMGSKLPPSPLGLDLDNTSPTTPSLTVTANTPPPSATLIPRTPITPTIQSSSAQQEQVAGSDPNKPYDLETRRRSVDVGGLALATRSRLAGYATGIGWGGWEECNERDIEYAELLSDMYSHTRIAVEMPLQHAPRSPSTPCAHRIPLKKRKKLIQLLNSWNFEPHKLAEDEIMPATELIFESLLRIEGLEEELGITLAQLCPFLHHVRQIYRSQNQYHNYIHALDVLQAVYSFLTKAGLVPPMSILWTEREGKEDGGLDVEDLNSTSPFASPTSALAVDIASIPIPPIPITPPTTRQRTTSTSSATSTGGGRKTGRPRSGKGKSGKTIRGSGAKEYKPPEGAAKKTWRRAEATPDAEGRKKLTDVLRNRDVFAVCLAAIGHDIGHPGNSNAFMKNAQTPLSILFDGKSALERMHCAIFLGLMKRYGLEHLLESTSSTPSAPSEFASAPTSPASATKSTTSTSTSTTSPSPLGMRKLLVGTVLATDMSWHFEWIERFKNMQAKARGESIPSSAPKVEGKEVEAVDGITEEEVELTEEEAEEEQRLLICQALMKCADISNPSRPHGASQYWSAALLEEWASQALLEKQLELPISVVANADESMQANGQVTFIDLFAQPLFDVAGSAIPEFEQFATMCRENRQWWKERLDTLRDQPKESISAVPRECPLLPPLAQYVKTVFPMSLPPSFLPPPDMPQSLSMASGWFMAGAQPITPITPSHASNSSSGADSPTSAGTSRPQPLPFPIPPILTPPALILVTPTSTPAVAIPSPKPVHRMTLPTPTSAARPIPLPPVPTSPVASTSSVSANATTITAARENETTPPMTSYVPINYADVQSALRAAYRVGVRPRVGQPSYYHHHHHLSEPSYDDERVPVDLRELVAS